MEEQGQLGPFVLPPQDGRLPMRIRGMHTTYGVALTQPGGMSRHVGAFER